jgi:hypothetical protein
MLFEEDHQVDPSQGGSAQSLWRATSADLPKVQVSLCASTIATYLEQSESTLASNGASGSAGLYP